MSVTAQEFRHAAECAARCEHYSMRKLLLAAAEQAEQVEAVTQYLKEAHDEINMLRELGHTPTPHCRFPDGCDIHDSPEVCAEHWRTKLYMSESGDREQIATLTAERDELAGWKAGALVSFSKWHQLSDALLPFADIVVGHSLPSELARQIPALLGKLSAERDEARALLAGSFDARWATILPSDAAKAAK